MVSIASIADFATSMNPRTVESVVISFHVSAFIPRRDALTKPLDFPNPNTPFLPTVSNAVRAVVWTGIHEFYRAKPVKHKNIDALRKQARGIFMSIAAFFIDEPDDIEQIVHRSKKLLEHNLYHFFENEEEFVKKMEIKQAEALIATEM